MKFFLKFIVLPLLTLFLLLIVGFYCIPQAKLRAYADREIGKRINRQIEIGPIDLGLRGLTIETLKLSEGTTFKSGMLLTAQGIRLGWDLTDLWKGLDVKKKFITRSTGHLHIDGIQNPHYVAKDLAMRWSLTDLDPTLAHLNGTANLEQGEGALIKIDELMATSPTIKIILAPLEALITVDKLGITKLALPDLKHWPIKGLHGEYNFKDGLMTIERFTMDSADLNMATKGTVHLATNRLGLETELHFPQKITVGALDMYLHITGTTAKPEVKMDSLKKKAFKATIDNL